MAPLPPKPLPHSTRSQVFTALFNYLLTIPSPTGQRWGYTSQYPKIWDEIDAVNQPALILHRGPQTAEQKVRFGITKWHWTANVWIYFRTDNLKTRTTYPDQLTDQFIDNFEQFFQTDTANGLFSLGGVCYHCWIDGTIIFDSGINDNQAVLLIPLSIIV